MTKTTIVINATITKILDGDHGQPFYEEDLNRIGYELESDLEADNVVVRSAKTFVMEEK